MSSRRVPPPPEPEVPEEERQQVALKVSEEFLKLSPQEQREFVDETLTALVNMSRKKLGKFFSKLFFKKGKPSVKQLETANQLIVVFLWSIKEEFRYHYATMIFKNMPGMEEYLEHTREKLQQVRELEPLHFLVSKPVGQRLYDEWVAQGKPSFDVFFDNLLNGRIKTVAELESGKSAVASKK
jgi:hypothetical protein